MNRSLYIFIVVVGIILAVAGVIWQQSQQPPATDHDHAVATVYERPETGQVEIGGAFSLTDHEGHKKTDLDFRGRYLMVYFGYSYCPDICPMALHHMTEALSLLGDQAKKIQPLFITVDPERDTAWHLSQYLKNYHPSFVGLTGSYADIQAVIQRYHVYASKITPDQASDYLMDHSSIIYIMDPQGRYIAHFNHNTAPEDMVSIMQNAMR